MYNNITIIVKYDVEMVPKRTQRQSSQWIIDSSCDVYIAREVNRAWLMVHVISRRGRGGSIRMMFHIASRG